MHVLGIDIGGSGIKAAIVDVESGELASERIRKVTPKPATPDNIAEVLTEIIEAFSWQGIIGCTFPTVVINGVAKYSSNLDPSWVGVNVEALFRTRIGSDQLTVINDADAAGLAEVTFGAGRDKKGMVVTITVGTGIGSGLFYNGTLIPNIEMGHMYDKKGRLSEKRVSDRSRKKHNLTYKKWGRRFDKYLKHVDKIFSPDYVIIGGGISKNMDKFHKRLTLKTPVLAAEKLNNAGIIGAAIHASHYLK